MSDQLTTQYSNEQLEHILEEAFTYMCACPAQVAEQLLQLRKLFAYQMNCISNDSLMIEVHQLIAESTRKAHSELEHCLHDVLKLEGWDQQTLDMPVGLRQLRQQVMDQE